MASFTPCLLAALLLPCHAVIFSIDGQGQLMDKEPSAIVRNERTLELQDPVEITADQDELQDPLEITADQDLVEIAAQWNSSRPPASKEHHQAQKPKPNVHDERLARAILGCLVLLSLVCLIWELCGPQQANASTGASRPTGDANPSAIQSSHLDALRFPAAAWVIAFHYAIRHDDTPWEDFVTKGRWAVTFFLILAGFTTHLSWRDNDSSSAFALRRLARVGLTYYASGLMFVFVRIGLCAHKQMPTPFTLNDIVAYVFMLQTLLPGDGDRSQRSVINGPSWFVASLAFCWVVYPACRGVLMRMSARSLWHSVVAVVWLTPCIFIAFCLHQYITNGVFMLPKGVWGWVYTWPPFCFIEFS